ncbi:MAG TPA: hypothetical protein VJA94_18395 [Candidatus Angelobacter sp.]
MKILRIVVVALLIAVLAAGLAYFVWHVRYVTYPMEWYNASETTIGKDLPDRDPFGRPKTVILARTRNGITCYTAYYSEELKRILNSTKPSVVHVSYRVSYWLNKPYWIQQTDIEHYGDIAAPEYMGQSAHGECF